MRELTHFENAFLVLNRLWFVEHIFPKAVGTNNLKL